MPKVINRKLVLIKQDLAAAIGWEQQILLCFPPDLMIVRQIMYRAPNAERIAMELRTTLVKLSGPIGVFCDGTNVAPQTKFLVESTIAGTYAFAARLTDGSFAAAATGKLMIALEFIEYEKEEKKL